LFNIAPENSKLSMEEIFAEEMFAEFIFDPYSQKYLLQNI